MNSQLRFIFVIFCFTALLIFTVHLRSMNDRMFYRLCTVSSEQNRLKQQLWRKQLELEALTNPAAISERFD